MAKKVDDTIARAFARGEKAKGNNTVCDGSAVYLHGHRIAWRDGAHVMASLCGWNTTTTRARLNAICQEIGAEGHFTQKDFAPYFAGREIDAREVVRLK